MNRGNGLMHYSMENLNYWFAYGR